MSDANERLLDVALAEHYGHGPDPDLPERILAGRGQTLASRGQPSRLLRFAGLVAATALIGWAIFAPIDRLPAGVSAAGAQYTLVEGAIEARSGWYLLSEGAPSLRAGGTRVEGVTGRVLVKAGEIPDEAELAEMKPWLAKHSLEEEMKTANWIKTGAVALCLLAGGVSVDGHDIQAQAMERKRVQELERELEEAREKLREAKEEANRQAEEGDGSIQVGDRITAINGRRVENMDDLSRIMREECNAGEATLELTIVRNGETKKLYIVVSREPRNEELDEGTWQPPVSPDESANDSEQSQSRYLNNAFNELGLEQTAKLLPKGGWRYLDWAEGHDGNDAAAELRRMVSEKERDLAELRRDQQENAQTIRDVERSIAALQAGLDALERASKGEAEQSGEWTLYTAKEGDSWWRIAHVTFKDRGLTTQDLQQANPGVELRPGTILRIPRGK